MISRNTRLADIYKWVRHARTAMSEGLPDLARANLGVARRMTLDWFNENRDRGKNSAHASVVHMWIVGCYAPTHKGDSDA